MGERFAVEFKVGTKIINTFSSRLVKSPVLYDLIKFKPEKPVVIDEDTELFEILLHYIRYPCYFPPLKVRDVFQSILEKYKVEPKYFTKNELYDISKAIIEENNGNIDEAFFKSYKLQKRIFDNIYVQGVDINYVSDTTKNLYDNLITDKSSCNPKFIQYLYNRGRFDLSDNLNKLLKKSIKYSPINVSAQLIDIFAENKFKFEFDLLNESILEDRMNLFKYLNQRLIPNKQNIHLYLYNSKNKEMTDLILKTYNGFDKKILKEKVSFNLGENTFSINSKYLVLAPVLYGIVEKEIEFNNNYTIRLEEDPKLFEIFLLNIKYPKYVIPNQYKEKIIPLIKKYNCYQKVFLEPKLSKIVKCLIDSNQGDINGAFTEAIFKCDSSIYIEIYGMGVDINFDVDQISNICSNAITAHQCCDKEFITFMKERGRKDLKENIKSIFSFACRFGTAEHIDNICSIMKYDDELIKNGIIDCISKNNDISLIYLSKYGSEKIILENKDLIFDKLISLDCESFFIFSYIINLTDYTITKEHVIKALICCFYKTLAIVLNFYLKKGHKFIIDEETVDKTLKYTHDRMSKLKLLHEYEFEIYDYENIAEKKLSSPRKSQYCTVMDIRYLNGDKILD